MITEEQLRAQLNSYYSVQYEPKDDKSGTLIINSDSGRVTFRELQNLDRIVEVEYVRAHSLGLCIDVYSRTEKIEVEE